MEGQRRGPKAGSAQAQEKETNSKSMCSPSNSTTRQSAQQSKERVRGGVSSMSLDCMWTNRVSCCCLDVLTHRLWHYTAQHEKHFQEGDQHVSGRRSGWPRCQSKCATKLHAPQMPRVPGLELLTGLALHPQQKCAGPSLRTLSGGPNPRGLVR